MNIHWMQNNDFDSIENLSKELEEIGYSSVLLTYNSNNPDLFVQAISNLKQSSITYNIAVRPHTISPELLAMIAQALESNFPGRFMFNFVSGNFYENENLEGIIHYDTSLVANLEYRRNYLSIFLDKFLNRSVLKHKPICMIGSSSEIAIKLCQKHDLMLAMTYENFMSNKEELLAKVPRLMINLPVILRSEIKDAQGLADSFYGQGDFENKFLVGNSETLLSKITELRGYNINDIMLSNVIEDTKYYKNHAEIKKALGVLDV